MNKLISYIFYLVIFLNSLSSVFTRNINWYDNNNGGCNININKDISTKPTPLFLNSDGTDFLRPSDSYGNIRIDKGQKILLSCSGSTNTLEGFNENEAHITCSGGKNFIFPNGRIYNSKDILCRRWPSSISRKSGTCLSGNTLYEIGFKTSTGFVQLFEFCHDTKYSNTLYTKFILTKEAVNGQRYVPRPNWLAGNIYGDVNVDLLYKRQKQIATIGDLLGSKELAQKYVHDNDDYFLARGHMVAKADFFYGAQQVNTFWYGNAAPQWQTFNGYNWKDVEMIVRNFTGKYGQDLNVYTGTFGNDVLPNIHGTKIELSLNGNGQIPVPKMYWKILHDPKNNNGIAVIGLNSPYLSTIDVTNNILCKDICDRVKWLNISPSQRKNVKEGYLYCCDVNEFRGKVKNVPNFKVNGILI